MRQAKATNKMSALQRLQDQLKWVDLIFEVRDARLPESSTHPNASSLFGSKPRIIILAKRDLADPLLLDAWVNKISKKTKAKVVALDLKKTSGREKLINLAINTSQTKKNWQAKLEPRPTRACVVGLPNVGKSSLINWLIGKKKTKVGNRPGVTVGTQWVRLHPKLELLDSPGIMSSFSLPKEISFKLAVFNLVNEGQYDLEETAQSALCLLKTNYQSKLCELYSLDIHSDVTTLDDIAKSRNLLKSGGLPDRTRAARMFLNELREGKLGNFIFDNL